MSEKSTACPISFEAKIDATILRINSVFYIFILWLAIFLEQPFIILILVIIFLSKNININRKCLLDYFTHYTASLLKFKEKLIDPAPKKLANAMGLAGSIAIFLSLYLDISFAIVPIGVMSIAFLLEAIFDYCIGCKIYAFTLLFKFN